MICLILIFGIFLGCCLSYSKLSGLNINKYDLFVVKLISYIYIKYLLL